MTDEPESESKIKISWHVPDFLKERWRNTVITSSKKTIRLGLGWCIADLCNLLPEDAEAGGLLSPDAVFMETGDHTSVSASSGTFTWHSHNEEPCLFSVQDWCSFILSSSLWSLLITPEQYRVYVKTDNRLVVEARSSILGYSKGTPSKELMSRRLRKLVSNQFPKIASKTTETSLGSAVGIHVGNAYQL